ncbi:MAG TPA: tripartite tricarboxylate transporter substrate binding protein [Burkholderiales bacterium]|nr:tripartite tricarboxylate transporter substrate binding protein [Burkholderiales bacterium]
MRRCSSRYSGFAGFLLPLAFIGSALAAESYPSRPVRMIVPFAAGGGADLVARVIGKGLSERLGQQVVIDNRAGAGGVIGVDLAARSAPDGYTLAFVPASFTMQPALRSLPYDPIKSFAPISRVGKGDYVLAINPVVPARTVKELIAYAKANPGKLFFGTAGAGSTAHMFTELFKLRAGVDINVVHFKGGNQQVIDLLGGHTQGVLLSLPAIRPHILAGKLRGLATTSRQRSSFFSGVPTLDESGLPGFDAIVWWGVLAPAGTPAPIVSRVDRDIKALLAVPEIRKAFSDEGVEPDYQDSAGFRAFMINEIASWKQVVQKANIKLE